MITHEAKCNAWMNIHWNNERYAYLRRIKCSKSEWMIYDFLYIRFHSLLVRALPSTTKENSLVVSPSASELRKFWDCIDPLEEYFSSIFHSSAGNTKPSKVFWEEEGSHLVYIYCMLRPILMAYVNLHHISWTTISVKEPQNNHRFLTRTIPFGENGNANI